MVTRVYSSRSSVCARNHLLRGRDRWEHLQASHGTHHARGPPARLGACASTSCRGMAPASTSRTISVRASTSCATKAAKNTSRMAMAGTNISCLTAMCATSPVQSHCGRQLSALPLHVQHPAVYPQRTTTSSVDKAHATTPCTTTAHATIFRTLLPLVTPGDMAVAGGAAMGDNRRCYSGCRARSSPTRRFRRETCPTSLIPQHCCVLTNGAMTGPIAPTSLRPLPTQRTTTSVFRPH